MSPPRLRWGTHAEAALAIEVGGLATARVRSASKEGGVSMIVGPTVGVGCVCLVWLTWWRKNTLEYSILRGS